MNHIETVLFGLLSGESTITSIVGDKITPLVAPQKAVDVSDFPHLVYSIEGEDDGLGNQTLSTTHNLMRSILYVHSCAETYGEMVVLSNAVYAFLNGYYTTPFAGVFYKSQVEEFIEPIAEDEVGIYHRTLTFNLVWDNT